MRAVVLAILLAGSICAYQSENELFERAVGEQQHGDFEAAIRDYRQLLTKSPGMVDARANLAAALAHLGRYDEAIAEYRTALAKLPNEPSIRTNLGLAYYKNGDFADAAREFAVVEKTNPGDPRTATLLGDCYLRLGKNQEAIELLGPLVRAHLGNGDLAFVLSSALLARAKNFIKMQNFARAKPDLERAEEIDPKLPGLYTLLGIVKESAADERGAEADLRLAVEQDPNDFQANLHLGGILYGRRDLDQARVFIDKALAINPDSQFAKYELALVDSAAGNVAKAVDVLEQIEKTDPKWLDPHVQLTALYYRLHRPQDGLRERRIVEQLQNEKRSHRTPP